MYAYFLQTFGAIAKGYKYSNRHYAYCNFRYREFQTFYLSSLYFFWRIPSSTLVWRAGSPTAHSSGTDRYISAILEDAPPEMLSSLWIMNHTILAKIDRTRASLELKSARITSRVLFPVLLQLPQFRFFRVCVQNVFFDQSQNESSDTSHSNCWKRQKWNHVFSASVLLHYTTSLTTCKTEYILKRRKPTSFVVRFCSFKSEHRKTSTDSETL